MNNKTNKNDDYVVLSSKDFYPPYDDRWLKNHEKEEKIKYRIEFWKYIKPFRG